VSSPARIGARPLLDREVSVRRAIVHALEDGGIDTVFGMPGGYTGVIYDAMYEQRDHLRVVLAREESLASVMGQAYGRLTGRPALVMGQAPFILAAAPGILEARLSHTPLLVITDTSVEARFAHHGGYQSGSGEYGSWDALEAFRAISTMTTLARGGAQTVQAVQLALKHALTGPGSATVIVPIDALRGRVGPESVPALYSTTEYLPTRPAAAPAEHIGEARDVIDRSSRPVIVAGQGVNVSKAHTELLALAEAIAAPIVTTAGGKGAVAETAELALGVFGTYGNEAANGAVAEADVLVVVGSRLSPSDAANENPALIDPRRQSIIQIDIDPLVLSWIWPVACPLLGDAAATMSALRSALADGARARLDRSELLSLLDGYRARQAPDPAPGDDPDVMPQQVIRALERSLPAGAFVCCDAGENRIFMTHYFRTAAAGTFLQPSGVGCMGYAIPAAMAAKLVHPDRAAVAVCGDGGFAMTLNGLMTAIEEDLPIVVVVMNNRSLGWVRHDQTGRVFASEFDDFDLAAICRAIGCEGVRVTRAAELEPAMEEAFASGGTAVVEVLVSREESFRRVQSELVRH
jgi:acetolactate synthase-1/2/3 large subunit